MEKEGEDYGYAGGEYSFATVPLDENILSIISILLGNGTRLFKDNVSEQLMTLVSIRAYDTDLAQLHYRKKEE